VFRSLSYNIPLKPIPWKRPGLNHNRFYNTQTHEVIAYRLYLEQQHGSQLPFSKAIHMDIKFYFPIPKSLRKRNESGFHKTVPDIDNLAKLVLDSCKPVIYHDDKIVSKLTLSKIYDTTTRLEITITELE
jgi:Holliday junction resolvase RusA-like endonuclease